MLNMHTTVIALLSATLLTACGGGDSASADVRTKYVGTWQENCFGPSIQPGGTRYHRERITIRLSGDTGLALISTDLVFLDSACNQPAPGEPGETTESIVTFLGSTKTLTDQKVVDKVRLPLANSNLPNTTTPAVLYTADNKLYIQANTPDEPTPVPVDGEGFPNALNLDDHYTKVIN
jgi:hypothetical protein